jgi:hypothetical protein
MIDYMFVGLDMRHEVILKENAMHGSKKREKRGD